MRFGLIWAEAFSGLRRNASMVISVVLVTFVSLTFVGAAILMQMQIGTMRGFWQDRAQVQIYMCTDGSTAATCTDGAATDDKLQEVEDKLASDALGPLVKEVQFQSQEDAYNDLVDILGEEEASFLTPEQMNAAFLVRLIDPADTAAITEAFAGTQGIEEVKDQLKLLDPLFSTLTVATYIAVGIAALMLIAAVLLIATTIRLSAFARRREIGIMRLVGASNRFIQTPFILEGVFAGLIGAVLASVTVLAGVRFGVEGYLRSRIGFITTWVDMGDAAIVVPVLLGIGCLLAALSAGFAIRRWLRA